jgi:Ca2+-binding RTX toxin-like protein
VSGLFSGTGSLDFLKPIAGALNFKIPLFNFTLGDKLGFGDLGKITGLAADIGNALQSALDALNNINIYVGIPPIPGSATKDQIERAKAQQPHSLGELANLLTKVINGDKVDLLSYSKAGGTKWGQSFCFTFLSLGVPGVADVHLDACFGGYIGWDYSVGFGLDTTGFYIDPSTHIGVSGGIYAGLHGGLRVLGFDLASADGRIGLDANARLSVRNPDPSQGDRIYLDEIFRPGENLLQSILGAMKVDFTIDVTAHVEAKLNLVFTTLTLFSHDWNLARLVDLHTAPTTTQSKRPVPLNLQNADLSHDPNVTLANGVLTIDGRGSAVDNPNLVLLSGKDHTVDANWQRHGIGHFTGVNQVRFLGSNGNDRVQVKPGFNISIYAQGGSGSNYFEAGDGGSTLLGGGHADPVNPSGATLVGGAGQDSLVGGPGNNLITAGPGDHSTLIGGSGNSTLYGGAGHDLLIGGLTADANDSTTGHDYIQGGTGDSTIWAGGGDDTIIAGTGNDEIHGGKGNDVIIAGATIDPRANPVIVTGGGNDTIWGGSGHMSIRGGAGNDEIHGGSGWNTIQGGTGNDRIYGGPNSDLLIAGSGNDVIHSGSDYNHKTTLVAGPGEDWLYAGGGDDLLRLPFGVNNGVVRSHFVGGPGHVTLAITTDAGNHFIRLTQGSANTFTVTSYADPGETQRLSSFNFDMPSDLHGNFIQTLALEAIDGNNKLDVAPEVGKNVALIGGTGNDTLVGGGGSNTLYGGTGNDLLQGGPTTGQNYNEFHGGVGNATMIGGPGNDVFYGGTGDNVMQGGNGRVIMYGGNSPTSRRHHDIMQVGAASLGAVLIAGSDVKRADGTILLYGNDVTMYGGRGQNVLLAGPGAAEMHAGRGDANLVGGTGTDTMYGGDGYDVLLGGQGDAVMYASDPTLNRQIVSPEDWIVRFDQLHDEIVAVRIEVDRVHGLLQNQNLTPTQRQDYTNEENTLVAEDLVIAQDIVNLDIQHLQNPVYHVTNMFVGGSGRNQIYGNSNANFLLAGTGPTSIYGGGGDDTVTGSAGKDTFFVPPAPDNANVVFTAQADGHGNQIPVVTIDSGAVHLVEMIHARGFTQFGVITGGGTNRVTVNLGSYGLYDLNVQCGSGNTTVDLSGFQGGATVTGGTGNDTILGGIRKDIVVNGGHANNWIDLRGSQGKATVQGGSGNDTVMGGSTAGLELDGGPGSLTYEVDGTNVQVKAEGSPSMLSVYLNGQLQTRISKATIRRLSVQGQPGDGQIRLGPFFSFAFPELIASAGAGNKTLDASLVAQRVSLLGGSGNDTLIGGAGPNFLYGGPGNAYFKNYKGTDTVVGGGGQDSFEAYDHDIQTPRNWTPEMITAGAGDYFNYTNQIIPDPGHGPALAGWQVHNTPGQTTTINLAFTFSNWGTYRPADIGPITGLDYAFDFRDFGAPASVRVGILLRQGNNYYFGGGNTYARLDWVTVSGPTLLSSSFTRVLGSQPFPDFSASGAPISIGFFTSTTGPRWFEASWYLNNFKVVIHSATPAAATVLRVAPATSSPVTGTPAPLTVTALDFAGNPLPSYRRTVHFTSTDPAAVLPPDYTFTAADSGVHTFSVTWKTAGTRTLTVVQPDNGFPTGMSTVNVLPAGLDHFQASTPTGTPTAGTAISLTVRAFDLYGNLDTSYTGTVHFTSTDEGAGLPRDYTFTTANGGVAVFTLTPRTTGNQTFNLRDTVSGINASVTVTVTPSPVAGFRVTPSTSSPNAGDALAVTVRAIDAFGNLVPSYTGTVQPPTSDGQSTPPSPYTFTAADHGTHTFAVTFQVAGPRTITFTDTVSPAVTGSTTVIVTPLAATTFSLTPETWSPTAGVAFRLTVIALDQFNNVATGYRGTVTFSGSDGGASLPADYTFTAADSGTHTFTNLVLRVAGTRAVVVGDKNNMALHSSLFLAVVPAAATTLQLVVSANSVTAGAPLTVAVTALDPYGNVAIGYRGTIHFTSSDAVALLPDNYTFTAADGGTQTFSVTLKTAGTQSVSAADTATPTITGTQGGILVTPASPARFRVSGSMTSTTAGNSFDVTVTAQDAYGNTVTGYVGTVHFSSADPYGAALPADYTFQTTDQGVHTFAGGATLYTAGTWDVTATDANNPALTGQGLVSVTPAAIDHFLVTTSVDGVSTVAGAAFDVTITAQDAYNNTVTDYTGTVTFSSQDPYTASLPADYTFQPSDMGTVTVSGGAILYTAGTWDVTVTDTVNPNLSGSDLVLVTPAPAVEFLVTAPATVTAGMAFDFTVAAIDPYGNTDTNYAGTVVFSTMDPAGIFSQTSYTFQPTDMGTATFALGATLNTPGTWDVTATDIDSGITGFATVSVQPPGPGASGGAGKGSGAADEEPLSASQPTTPAGRVLAEGDASLRVLADLGITDLTNPAMGLEPLTAARPHHVPLNLADALDQLFMEDELIG